MACFFRVNVRLPDVSIDGLVPNLVGSGIIVCWEVCLGVLCTDDFVVPVNMQLYLFHSRCRISMGVHQNYYTWIFPRTEAAPTCLPDHDTALTTAQ